MFELPVGLRRKDPSFKVIWIFAFEERKVKKLLTKDEIIAVKVSEVVERIIEALPIGPAKLQETQRKISLYLASNLILGLVRVHYYQVNRFVISVERALERIDEPVPEPEIVRRGDNSLQLSPVRHSPIQELELDVLPPLDELDDFAVEQPMNEGEAPLQDFLGDGQPLQDDEMNVQVEGRKTSAPKERRRRRKRRVTGESDDEFDFKRHPRQRRNRKKKAGQANFVARHEDITMPPDAPNNLFDELERELANDDLVPLDPNAFADLENNFYHSSSVAEVEGARHEVQYSFISDRRASSVPVMLVNVPFDINGSALTKTLMVQTNSTTSSPIMIGMTCLSETPQRMLSPAIDQTNFVARHEDVTMPVYIQNNLFNDLERDLTNDDLVPFDVNAFADSENVLYRSSSVTVVEGARHEVQYSFISDPRASSVPVMLVDVPFDINGSALTKTLMVHTNSATSSPFMIGRTFVPQTPQRLLSPAAERPGTPVLLDVVEIRNDVMEVVKTPRKVRVPRVQGLMSIDELKRRRRRFIHNRKRRGEAKHADIVKHIAAVKSAPVSFFIDEYYMKLIDEALKNNLGRLFNSRMNQVELRRHNRRSEMPSSGIRHFTPLQDFEGHRSSSIPADGVVDSLLDGLRPKSPMQMDIDYTRSSPVPYDPLGFSRPKTPESHIYRDIEYVEPLPLPEGLEHLMSPPRPVPKNIFNTKKKIPNLSCNVTDDQFFTYLVALAFKNKNPCFIFEDLVKDWPRVYIAVNFQNLMMLSQKGRILLFDNEGKTKFLLSPTDDCKKQFKMMFLAYKQGWSPM